MKWNISGTLEKKDAIVDTFLSFRGIDGKKKKEFLNPPHPLKYLETDLENLKFPLVQAKKLILDTIKNKTPIIIFGDYDSDGINATAILYNTLKKELNYEYCFTYIPSRFSHGYGLSKGAIDDVLEKVVFPVTGKEVKALFITVDTGITCVEEISYLKELGHKILLTDHHQKPDILPECDVLVWEDRVVGASLAWFISQVLGSKNKELLVNATIATVTDVYPLVGVNRAIVKRGLEILNKNPPQGIRKLLDISQRGKEITTYDVGWVIGPRLNAAGRLEDGSVSLDLLIGEDEENQKKIAYHLNQLNNERQEKTQKMVEMASQFADETPPKIIISESKDYHEGVIGLVASELVKKYHRPAIVVAIDGDTRKGSARSIKGINIIEALREFSELFVNVGGHPMAAGFTIEKENFDILKKKLATYFEDTYEESVFERELRIDFEIPLDFVDMKFLKEIQSLEPFGTGNSAPVFVSRGVGVTKSSIVGRDRSHLSLQFYDGTNFRKGIFFGGAKFAEDINEGDVVSIAYSLSENNFNGKTSVDLMIKDIKKE